MTMEWVMTERGHHRLDYRGHVLEITRRRPDSFERRTYVVHVDGRQDPVPLWDLKSAKTKALRKIMNDPESGQKVNGYHAEVLEVWGDAGEIPAAEPEALPEVLEPAPHEVLFTITGSFAVGDIGVGLTTIETVMQALRERGPASCTLQMPKTLEM